MSKIVVLSNFARSLFWFRLDMMLAFKNAGYEIVAVGPESEKEWREKFLEYGIKYKQIIMSRNGLNPITDYNSYLALKAFFREEAPDKVFAYFAKPIAYGCPAARNGGVKEVYAMVGGLGSIIRGKGLKNTIIKKMMCLLYKNAFKCCDKVFYQNDDDLQVLEHCEVIERDKMVRINGSGVNLEKFTSTSYPNITTFLYIGRLIRDKGIYEYLEACRIIRERYLNKVRCLLIGPYDTNPSALKPEDLQPYIDNNIVEYFGEQTDVRPFIKEASVYVLPSYHEGTPKTVLESMAMKRAIITSDAPGCRETVIHGVNGFLSPVKDITSIVNNMSYFIDHPFMIESMGEKSLEIANKKFDVNKINAIIMKTMNIN